ncbi:MAG: hypothetical protein JO292_05250 [Betaproteobacteria bacterium]|nr:hypothetical protein [Betaproteobacteria bacterium]
MDLASIVSRVRKNHRTSKAIVVATVIFLLGMAMLLLPGVSPNWNHMGWITRSLGFAALFVLWISVYRMMK